MTKNCCDERPSCTNEPPVSEDQLVMRFGGVCVEWLPGSPILDDDDDPL